jgi:predicted RNA-binding protein
MNYWLFVTSPENYEVSRERNLLGFAEKYKEPLSQVHRGDKGLIYIAGMYVVRGDYKIISEAYFDNSRIFKSPVRNKNEIYALRLKLKCLTPSTEPIPFRPLVRNLSFIKNKKRWGPTLQGRALLEIPEADYLTIIAAQRN